MPINDLSGIILSIIGLWLTSAGIVGEKRLRTIEVRLRNQIYGEQGFMRSAYRKLFEWLRTMVEDVYPRIYTIVFIVVLVAVLYFGIFFFNWLREISTIENEGDWFFSMLGYFCALSLSIYTLIYTFTIVVGILSLPLIITLLALMVLMGIWLTLLPYIISDLISLRYSLESPLAFLGVVIGTIGILLLEVK